MPTNKTKESVMRSSKTQMSLDKLAVSPGHSLLAHISDPLLCHAHIKKGGACRQRLRQNMDLRLPVPPDKHAQSSHQDIENRSKNAVCQKNLEFYHTFLLALF